MTGRDPPSSTSPRTPTPAPDAPRAVTDRAPPSPRPEASGPQRERERAPAARGESGGQAFFAYFVGGLMAVAAVMLTLVLQSEPRPLAPLPRPRPRPEASGPPRLALETSEVLPPELVAAELARAQAQARRSGHAPVGQRTVLQRGPSPAPTPAPDGEALPSFGELVWPAGTRTITSDFGHRLDPVERRSSYGHRGLDIRCACGTPVLAALSGRVASVERSAVSGNVVRIDHPQWRRSRYAHLAVVEVRSGEWVAAGQRIGLSGATGRVTGPHLHFELWEGERPLNPRNLRYRFLPETDFFRPVRVSAVDCGTVGGDAVFATAPLEEASPWEPSPPRFGSAGGDLAARVIRSFGR